MSAAPVSVNRYDLAWAAALPALALLLMRPALSAFYYADDYFFVAMARGLASPLDFFTTGHFFGNYLYRPLPLSLWWLIERLDGGARLQYAANALLLGACGAALFWLLRELGWRRQTALPASALFILLPGNLGTALWLADRFDLMAVPLLFAAAALWLRHARSGDGHSARRSLACFLLAALSKELSYMFPLLMAVVLVLKWRDWPREAAAPRRRLLALVAGYALIVFGLLAWRAHLGIALNAPDHGNGALAPLLAGALKWWRALPAALAYARAPADEVPAGLAVLLALTLAALGVAAWRRSRRLEEGGARRAGLALGGAILLLAPLVQAPHLAISNMEFAAVDGTQSGMFAERFFFFGSAGLLLFLANGLAVFYPPRGPAKLFAAAGALAACALVAFWSVGRDAVLAAHWPVRSGVSHRTATLAAEAARRLAPEVGVPCRLRFLGSGDAVFQVESEAMVKVIAADARVDRCIVETETPPMFTLTHPAALPWYRLPAPDAQALGIARIAGWIIMPGGQAGLALAPAATQELHLAGAAGFVAGGRP